EPDTKEYVGNEVKGIYEVNNRCGDEQQRFPGNVGVPALHICLEESGHGIKLLANAILLNLVPLDGLEFHTEFTEQEKKTLSFPKHAARTLHSQIKESICVHYADVLESTLDFLF